MFVEFWDVGAAPGSRQRMPMSIDDICEQLTLDWVPSLPPANGTAFIGWPPFLIEELPYGGFLSLREPTGRSERQWKMILSWMLAVAGARTFLLQDGYSWIAP